MDTHRFGMQQNAIWLDSLEVILVEWVLAHGITL